MAQFDALKDICERTGGDIYIGVVGPVRSGKSAFIKRFMELLVLPRIEDARERERARDELPQCAAGRTIMTTEPKFIPEDAVQITVRENIQLRVRMVDCVGYAVEGALGYTEAEGPRMVMTPWFDHAVPFEEAAETGTRKVISEHSTIGLVVTTDGTITDIPRDSYVGAEERVVRELRELGKPFVIVLNSSDPQCSAARELAAEIEQKYDVATVPIDCLEMGEEDVQKLFEEVLYEFPVKQVNMDVPSWVNELADDHWLRQGLTGAIAQVVEGIKRVRDIEKAMAGLRTHEAVSDVRLRVMDLGSGTASVDVGVPEQIFYRVLTEIVEASVEGKHHIVKHLRELTTVKKEFDKVADGLREVKRTGYGVVPPRVEEMVFEVPELIKQGNRFAVRLRASAPSLHFIRADIQTEITPVIGTEREGEELVRYLLEEFEEAPEKIWSSNIFGKSLHALVRDGIQSKLYRMPENVQEKLQDTLERIVNESGGGLICIII